MTAVDNRTDSPALGAERIVLGAMLTQPEAVAKVRARLDGPAFSDWRHAQIYDAILAEHDAGHGTDPVTVAAALQAAGMLGRCGGVPYLHDLVASVPVVAQVGHHATLVAEEASRRAIRVLAAQLGITADLDDPNARAVRLTGLLDQLGRAAALPTTGLTDAAEVDQFLQDDGGPDVYHWVIPGLLERGDRVILTGREGFGKSTLLRQFAVQAAAGIHPFTLEPITPVKVLLVDLENGESLVRRKLRPIRLAAGSRYDPEPGLHIICRPEGLDLMNREDVQFLEDEITIQRPDILILGPLYKLSLGEPTEEVPARTVAFVLDRLRVQYGFALLMEAHSPSIQEGGQRAIRPYGASLWLRWPEFGLFLGPNGAVQHWRGARDERDWPTAMTRGGAWPFITVRDERRLLFLECVRLCEAEQAVLTEREMARKTSKSQATVHRAIDLYRPEWDTAMARIEEGPAEDQSALDL